MTESPGFGIGGKWPTSKIKGAVLALATEFGSLDAETLLPVLGGRWLWSLNYVYSRFNVRQDAGTTHYHLIRRRGPWPPAATAISWQITRSRSGRSFSSSAACRIAVFCL